MLKWLHARGCPWDETTCSAAAEAGHLEVLQWACKNGCPWDKQACTEAGDLYGHGHIINWLESAD